MFAMNAVASIAIVMLVPFWWALGLLILALLGDLSSRWRPRVSRLLARLEHMRAPSPNEPAISPAAVA
jgi:hypothetical protein